jgi:hypothetical protein
MPVTTCKRHPHFYISINLRLIRKGLHYLSKENILRQNVLCFDKYSLFFELILKIFAAFFCHIAPGGRAANRFGQNLASRFPA